MGSTSPILRPLGKNGPLVPRIGFGTMGMGFPCSRSSTPMPDPERLALLDRAYELGCTFWDISDFYGDAEEIVGKWIALNPEKRKDLFLATKFGAVKLPNGFSFRGDAAYPAEAVEKSLKRLNTDYIDLYYPHRLKEQGRIHHLGLSEVSPTTLRRAHAVHPIACVQMEYSLFSTEIEDPAHGDGDLLSTCRDLGVAVVAYSPLSRGLLGGGGELPEKNMELVAAVRRVADQKGVTVGQVALAWLLAQGEDVFPIPGTIHPKYLDENFAAMHVELTADESRYIRDLVDKASVFGDRWPKEHALGLFADTPALEGWRGPEEREAVVGTLILDGESGKA
ncbi:putative Aldo-keto reductase [Coniochaeta hoffmannii]|uniref:Aldo-keto reductase n=1 Tax=Coniochaeta hoffmannii TaxID=91930 RepID=A0AA38SKZ9_9PEZI|nr:putative Aldo-keto reductase [Coniochaeta hoffmannii]